MATGTFFVSMESGDSYLSSSTKIIKIGGFTANFQGGGGNHPSFGRCVTKMAQEDEG